MKINKLLKAKKAPVLIVSGVLFASLVGGAYYLSQKQDSQFGKTQTEGTPTTDAQVQQNVDKKGEAATDGGTTPTATTTESALTTLADVSLSILLDTDKTQAYVYLYGPAGTYGVEKLASGSWTIVEESFNYIGRGGYGFDTITSTPPTVHYRVYKLEGGKRTVTSGDTAVNWQEILTSGTLTVPLAE